jgi:hypothetical protein
LLALAEQVLAVQQEVLHHLILLYMLLVAHRVLHLRAVREEHILERR